MRIRISLPEDRDYAGWLEVVDESGAVALGPVPAAGRAHDAPAKAHGNAFRTPLQPFGDTPLGAYVVGAVIDTGPGTALDEETHGPNGVVLLEPVSGPAALADAHGRFRLFIQGGGDDERLRATAGAVRLFDRDQKRLVALMRQAAKRAPCEIVTAGTPGEKIDLTRAPVDLDPPALSNLSRPSMPPVAIGSREARPAKRFFVAPERSGSTGGSTSYGGGEDTGPDTGVGSMDTGPDAGAGSLASPDGGVDDTIVGTLPASGSDVAPMPDADLNPPQDQTDVTLAQSGADQLLSTSPPTGLSSPYDPNGWLTAPPLGSPYSPGITDLSDPLAPYLGANAGAFAATPPGADANSLLGSPAAYPYFGAPQDDQSVSSTGRDTSGYQAMNGDGFVAPPPPSDDPRTTALLAALGGQGGLSTVGLPSSGYVDATMLQGLAPVGQDPVLDPNGNQSIQYQVTTPDGVTYNAYLNDMKYPGQALLVPISQLDTTLDQTDFGPLLSTPGNSFASGRSSGPVTPASPVQNQTPIPSGLPPIGASDLANALAAQFPLGGMPQPPPLAPPLPMPWGLAAEGPVARLYYPNSLTLPPNFPAYDLVQADNYTESLTYERGTSGATRGQPITVVNQEFQGGDWVSVKTTTSSNVMNELSGALSDMVNKGGGIRDTAPVDPNLPNTFLRVLGANPDSATIHILIPEGEAGAVPGLQAQVNAEIARSGGWDPADLPPNLSARVTAWPGTDLANPNPAGPPDVGFGTKLGSSGVYGAGVGAGMASFFQVSQMAFSSQQYTAGDYAGATLRSATAGGLSGATGSAIETAFASQVSQQFAQSTLGGIARGALGGGPAAAIFQVTSMALSDQSYTAQDYVAKGGTAAIEGALAGALSSAMVGAVGGSVAPGVGTAIGFAVGFAAFFLINYDFGEEIEGGLRGAMK